jgi:hypothetical protein
LHFAVGGEADLDVGERAADGAGGVGGGSRRGDYWRGFGKSVAAHYWQAAILEEAFDLGG